jgi:hypothetical protein
MENKKTVYNLKLIVDSQKKSNKIKYIACAVSLAIKIVTITTRRVFAFQDS